MVLAEHEDPKGRTRDNENRHGWRLASIHGAFWAVLKVDPMCRRAWNDRDRCASHFCFRLAGGGRIFHSAVLQK